MSLFGSKDEKKEMQRLDLGSLPPLPEFPTLDSVSGPSYTPTVSRPTMAPPRPNFEVPSRASMPRPPMPSRGPSMMEGEKPLFVKIDKYRNALKAIDNLKSKIREAEGVLVEVSSVRQQEDQKLDEWRRDLKDIREKLLTIDQNLFEV